MESNFAFLRAEWPDVSDEASQAERAARSDPRSSCFYARRTLEQLVYWLYDAESTLRRPRRDGLKAHLHTPSFKTLVGENLHGKADLIRLTGNSAVHGRRIVRNRDAEETLRELFHLGFWLASNYSRSIGNRPDAGLHFDAALLSEAEGASKNAALTQAQLQRLAKDLAARDAELAKERAKSEDRDAENERLRAEVAAARRAHGTRSDRHDYDEDHTRDLLIDRLLKEAGWDLGPESLEVAVTGTANKSNRGRVDYVLWADNGKPLALIEAKRTKRDPREGQQQAKLYADCLEEMHGQRPVIYYSNGYQHWMWDDTRYPPRTVEGFHKKDELELLIQRRNTGRTLAEATINHDIIDRLYQERAVRRVTEAFERDKQRKALIAMATGAGKTRTVAALIDVLMRCNWVKNVLFLADRLALVDQAVKVFKQHLPGADPVDLVRDKSQEGRVFVSTYGTMIGLIEQGRFGIGHFDLVIIDEAHRSVYRKYRSIFSYFDSFLVGLTATPRDEIDRNTYSLFNLENGIPTDSYSLDEAVDAGWLVPPRAIDAPLGFPTLGIRYDDLSEAEKEQWDEIDWSDEGEKPNEVEANDVNRWLFNTDTVDKVLQTLMDGGQVVAGGDRLGKTIIFAKNNRHAHFICERFNALYPQRLGGFASVITYKTEESGNLITQFGMKEKQPHIAVSVDMLDTGIDVPEVVNLVFFKVVRSRTKFWQMLGRGTRLCPDLFGPDQDKAEFFVFDFCRNFEFFNQNPELSEGRDTEPLSQRLFKLRLELLGGLDRPLSQRSGDQSGTEADLNLRENIADLLHRIVLGVKPDSFEVRPHREWVDTYRNRTAWNQLGAEKLAGMASNLSGLPTAERDDDEEAKRFDHRILRAQLCVLNAEPGFDRIKDTVREIAASLLGKTSIPAISQHQVFLEALSGEEWWQDVTLSMLEEARVKVRSLVKLMDKVQRKIVYSDFEDHLGDITEVELTASAGHVNQRLFRSQVRDFLQQHEDHVTLHKLRRNHALTDTDLAELERMLIENGRFDEAMLKRSAEQAQGLGLFVRSLVGLTRSAAEDALSSFLKGKTLSSNQIEFVDMVVDRLTQTGAMDAEQLYEAPFLDVAKHGPDTVFSFEEVSELERVLEDVKARASAS